MEQRRGEVLPEVVLAVWQAEDGRCESCKRAMDRRWARVARLDEQGEQREENLQLLCVDCKARRPDPLRSRPLVFGGEAAERVLGGLGAEQVEAATRWLKGQLQRYGVLITGGKKARLYWLPGVGTFRIVLEEDGTARVVKAEKLSPQPQVREKPQARTRGLPRPDRSPLPVKAPKRGKAVAASGNPEPAGR